MTNCQWCGEPHSADRLCERAQRGMTRRSFCFLFSAGVGAAALGVLPLPSAPTAVPLTLEFDYGSGWVVLSEELLKDSQIDMEKLFARGVADHMTNTISGYWDLIPKPGTLTFKV